MKHISIVSAMETKSYFRNSAAIFWTVLYPVLLLIILNTIFGQKGDSSYTSYLICGMVALTVLTVSLFGFAIGLVSLREAGKLKMYQVFPITKFSYICGFAVSRLIILVLFSLLFVVSANMAYRADLLVNINSLLNLSMLVLIGGGCFISMGFMIIAFVGKLETASTLSNIVFFPVMFLSDLFIPFSVLPDGLQSLAEYSPIYVFVDACRDILINGSNLYDLRDSLFIFVALGVLSLIVSRRYFDWSPKS